MKTKNAPELVPVNDTDIVDIETEKDTVDPVQSISERLSNKAKESETKEVGAKEQETKGLDIASLSPEQIRQLRAVLASTPDRIDSKNEQPIMTLRRVDGKYVVEHKNAVLRLVQDSEQKRDVQRHFMKIRFYGEDDFVEVPLDEFMLYERVRCTCIDIKTDVKEMHIGETISKETGRKVEMVNRVTIYSLTLLTPDGITIVVDGDNVNK